MVIENKSKYVYTKRKMKMYDLIEIYYFVYCSRSVFIVFILFGIIYFIAYD